MEIKIRAYFPSTKVMTGGLHLNTLLITCDLKDEVYKDACKEIYYDALDAKKVYIRHTVYKEKDIKISSEILLHL